MTWRDFSVGLLVPRNLAARDIVPEALAVQATALGEIARQE